MKCKNCRKPITFMESSVHDYYFHTETGLQACSVWISGKWAEPEEENNGQ